MTDNLIKPGDKTAVVPSEGTNHPPSGSADDKLEEIRAFVDSLAPEELDMLQEYLTEKTQAEEGDPAAASDGKSADSEDIVDLSKMN